MSEKWEFGTENETKTHVETARLFFHQAERMLESTNLVKEHLGSKAFQIISLFAPISLALIAFVIHTIDEGSPVSIFKSPAGIAAVLTVLYLLIPLITSLRVARPSMEFFAGSEPRKLMNPYFCGNEFQKSDRQTVAVLVCECENYQRRIDANIPMNAKNAKRISRAVSTLVFSPVLAAVVFVVAVIFF